LPNTLSLLLLLLLLTGFDDPLITSAFAVTTLCQLLFARQWHTATSWCCAFLPGVCLVALTKCAYAGWDIGIDALHFTGISAHAMLSAAVYPLVFALCASRSARLSHIAAFGGTAFALVVGVSRLVLDPHCWAEVLTGWSLGTGIAAYTLRSLKTQKPVYSARAPQSRDAGMQDASTATNVSPGRRNQNFRRGIAALVVATCLKIAIFHKHIAPVSGWL
jgi:hypothetical protein